MEILIGIATSVASLVIGRWLGRRDAQKLRQEIGDDFEQKLRQWRTEGLLEPVRDERTGEITGITGRAVVAMEATGHLQATGQKASSGTARMSGTVSAQVGRRPAKEDETDERPD